MNFGDTGQNVRTNLRRLREAQRLSVAALADRLADYGLNLAASGVSRVERGERQVTVDDLVAFAAALGIEAADLLVDTAACRTCNGEPPEGFTCRTCGAPSSGSNEPRPRQRGRHGRPDEFYVQITDLYQWHGPNGSAVFIGELHEVPKTTAQRWIKEARRRGILKPFAERECHMCGRPHTPESLQFDRQRRAKWARGK